MNILVCVKQVFDDSIEVRYDEDKKEFIPKDITMVENAFDTYSLEMATRLKESVDGKVDLLSIGTEETKNALKNCLAVGGDEAALILEENYQSSDSYSIAKTLADGIRQLEEKKGLKYDVIFCGKETTDFTSGQVGVILSNILDMGVMTNLVDINVEDGKIIGKHETDMGYDVIEGIAPCVVTVSKPIYDPRYATIKSKMAARKKEINELSAKPLDVEVISIKRTYSPPKREAGIKIMEKTPEESVEKAMTLIAQAKVL